MNFLFWNIKKKDNFLAAIQNVVREEAIDVIAFAEFPIGQETAFEAALQSIEPNFKYLRPIKKNKIEIYYKDGVVDIHNALDGERISANIIISNIDNRTYQLVFCHVWDRVFTPEKQQLHLVPDIVDEIKEFENDNQNELTIVCGDFNMDAFSDGMLLHKGFNAMMTSDIALRKKRRVNKRDYSMFYNPMWGLYGDVNGQDVAGTYYYRAYHPVHQYWHMLDQVIMRPRVIPVFDKTSLKIAAKGQTYNLLDNNGIIDKDIYSDHLPIKFKLNI